MSVVINPQNCSGDCNSCRYTDCVNNSKHKSTTTKFQEKWSDKTDLPTGKDKYVPQIAEAIALFAVILGCTMFAFITLKLLVQ